MSKKKESIKQPAKKVESTPAAASAPVSAPAPAKPVEAAKPAPRLPTPGSQLRLPAGNQWKPQQARGGSRSGKPVEAAKPVSADSRSARQPRPRPSQWKPPNRRLPLRLSRSKPPNRLLRLQPRPNRLLRLNPQRRPSLPRPPRPPNQPLRPRAVRR